MIEGYLYVVARNFARDDFLGRTNVLSRRVDHRIARSAANIDFHGRRKCAHNAHALDRRNEVLRGEARLRNVRLGDYLLIIREFPFDTAIDENHILIGEDDLVFGEANADEPINLRQRGNFLQKSARDDCLEAIGNPLDGKVSNGEAVRVRRHQAQSVFGGRNQNASENRAALVFRDHLRDALDHRAELRKRNLYRS